MEVLVGLGLASAAGLNAYLPLLLLGVLARWTDLVPLPQAWDWLTDPVALSVLGVLLVVEVVADKVPGLDHLNDVLGAVVRPVAGGIAVGAGTSSTLVDDPGAWAADGRWVPVVLGAGLALAVSLTKSATRAAVNATTVGAGAPVASTAEDAVSLGLTLAAILAPVLVLLVAVVALVGLGLGVRAVVHRRQRRGSPRRGAKTIMQ